jgi:signal transduction histidine kinase/CheY-like chemotaxis protein/ligand-binding sensor domain-containing protein
MRFVVPGRLLLLVTGGIAATALQAQRPLDEGARATPIDTFARQLTISRRFGPRDGLERVPVLHVTRSRDGTLWLGTAIGPMHWDGTRFVRVPLPAPYGEIQVRRILVDSGTIWAGTVRGLFRLAGRRGWAPAGPVPSTERERRTWSLAMWHPAGRPRRLVASIEDSVVLHDPATGARVGALRFPAGTETFGAMVAVTRGAAGELLWAATHRGGLWRFRAGDSLPVRVPAAALGGATVHEDVRACPQLGPGGIVVATDAGAFALGDGVVPRRVGTAREVVRVACTGVRGNEEYWLGTRGGELVRLRGDGTTRVTLAPGPVAVSIQALEVVEVDDADPAIFVSRSTGGLWRGRAGGATTLVLPPALRYLSYTAIMEQPLRGGRRRVLASADGNVTLDLAHPADATPRTAVRFANFIMLRDSSVIGIADVGLHHLDARGWTVLPATRGLDVLTATRVARPAGETLVVSLQRGLFAVPLGEGTLVPVAPAIGGAIERLAHDSVGDVLWATRRDTIFRVHFATGRIDTLSRRDGLPPGPYSFTRVAQLADGRRVAIIGARMGVAIGDAGAARPRFSAWDTTSLPGLAAIPVNTSALLPDGRLVLGTAAGAGIWQLGDDLTERPRAVAWFDTEDGLDDGMVHRVMPSPDRTRLWLATGQGIAEIPLLARRSAAPAEKLSVLVTDARGSRVLRDSALLRWDARTLRVSARLVNLRHEEGTRYAISLRGRGDPETPPTWNVEDDRTFEALSDGDYLLSVRARDWLGRETPARVYHLTVLPPWWRAPGTLAVGAVLGLGAAAAGVRARTRRLRRRASEAEAAAARIRDSEERFRLLFDRGVDAQLLLEERTIVGANPAALALLGEPRADLLVGREIDAVLDAPPLPAGEDVTGTARAVDGSGIPVTVRRTEIPLGRGTVMHVELHDQRETERLAGERRELEQQLMASQRLESLGTLAGGVAHDFNNLLTIIRMNAELADESVGVGDASEAREALTAVVEASDRARDIVRQILTFSRRTPPSRRPLRLGEALQAARPLLRATLPATVGLELRDDAGDGGWIAGDATQLQQLLLNLASNAEHAMRGSGGTLTVVADRLTIGPHSPAAFRALAPGEHARLVVADTGCGMSEATLARVFEPFFTTKPVGEGTGLGLAVLHGIVAAHGGAVHVQSAPGSGTRFEIVFPRIAAPLRDDVGAVAGAPAAASRDGAGATVVLVDDEPALLRIAERALRDAGFMVEAFADAHAALARLEATSGRVACVVTDQTMPGMTGDALAQVVAGAWPTVPIVIATGFAARIPSDALRRARVSAVLEKPYERAELVSVVTRAIEARGGVTAPA